MNTLVIAEHDNHELKSATLNTISAAAQLGTVCVLVTGHSCRSVAEQVAALEGVDRVLICESQDYEYLLAEQLAPLVVSLAGDFTHLLAPATTFGKNLMPRVAALLDVAQISEIVSVVDADCFQRPIYAGNVIATIRSNDAVKVITVRSTTFEEATSGDNAPIEEIGALRQETRTRFLGHELSVSDRPELTTANIVVSGGRGLASAENFKMLEALADKLDAAVGASRAAVDSGFVPNDYQVGQTGKIVAPDLYIAVGISGAIQHLAGTKDSKIIVAINNDEEAPIFQVADYGLVADLFEALPDLDAAL